MALAHQTPRSATTAAAGPPDRADALHELTAALAGTGDCLGREVLAAAVEQLEALAGAPLGAVGTDPVVALQRRAARALRLLVRCGPAADATLLRAMAADLRDPCAALLRPAAEQVPATRPATTAREG